MYYITLGIVFLAMVLFALSGCATNKPVDTLKELICPPAYLNELNASEQASDRLEDELSRARADSNAYMIAHRRCMDRFNINLSKSR